MSEVRLIDANALIEAITSETRNEFEFICLSRLFEIIDDAPTVPQTIITEFKGCDNCELERPHGEWVDEGQYAEGHSEHAYTCKKCGYQIIEKPNMISENRFCKNCGADMRKGGAE